MPLTNAIKDRNFRKHVADLFGLTSVRVSAAFDFNSAKALIEDALYLENARYVIVTEDDDYLYGTYYSVDDVFAGGFRASKSAKRVDKYFPFLFQEDSESKILTQNDEAILI